MKRVSRLLLQSCLEQKGTVVAVAEGEAADVPPSQLPQSPRSASSAHVKRFCGEHHKGAEALRYQGKQKNPEITKAIEETLSDPVKAKLALDEFARQNPEGRFRKRLLDWGQFLQKFGRRAEVRHREQEEEMDATDYIAWQKSQGKSDQEALAKWKEVLADPSIGRSGEGMDAKVWIVKNKLRFQDDVRFKECSVQEGSKATKDLSETDRPACRHVLHIFQAPSCQA